MENVLGNHKGLRWVKLVDIWSFGFPMLHKQLEPFVFTRSTLVPLTTSRSLEFGCFIKCLILARGNNHSFVCNKITKYMFNMLVFLGPRVNFHSMICGMHVFRRFGKKIVSYREVCGWSNSTYVLLGWFWVFDAWGGGGGGGGSNQLQKNPIHKGSQRFSLQLTWVS